MAQTFDPVRALASARHEFGEHGGVNLSVERSTTFTVLAADLMPEIFAGRYGPERGGCYLYARHFNPTVYALGRQLAAMEATGMAYGAASGMAAIACALLQLVEPGGGIVSSDTVYGGTHALLKEFLPQRVGARTTFVDIADLAVVEEALTAGADVLYTETVANPTLNVADIGALSRLAHAHDARLVVDNTFTPLVMTPAILGADVVVHSLTKFVSGASDVIAGAVCGSEEFIMSMMDLHTGSLMLLGPTMDPRVAFDLSLRLPHLPARMIEHGARALTLATRLRDAHVSVIYPGLEEHPQHDLFTAQMNEGFGFGGILAIDAGTVDRAHALMERLQNTHSFGYMAVSLGYFETLMSCSGSTTSSELSEEEKARAGVSPGLVRMSIGLTGSLDDRWRQLEESLRHCGMI